MSAGKGDKPRPVNKEKFDENFDAIFGPRKPWLQNKKSSCCIDCGCKDRAKKNKKSS